MEILDLSSVDQFQDRLKWNKNNTHLTSVCDTVSRRIRYTTRNTISRRVRDKYGRAREAKETVGDLNVTFCVIYATRRTEESRDQL
jgi:hypothetical protein